MGCDPLDGRDRFLQFADQLFGCVHLLTGDRFFAGLKVVERDPDGVLIHLIPLRAEGLPCVESFPAGGHALVDFAGVRDDVVVRVAGVRQPPNR